MINLQNVTKRYYSLVAVDDVSFSIPQGEVLGVLGPNGAGKTTLLKIIAGFLNPDEGTVSPQNGLWPAIGFKPERLLFPNQMRVREYLTMVAQLSNISGSRVQQAVQEALELVKLVDASQKRINDCSKGMRQRLAMAQSIIGRPSLLLLDEPSNGLDPEGQSDICQIIQWLQAEGQTIVLSSHHLQEVTQVCTYLIILNHGRVYYERNVQEALALRPHVTIKADGDLTTVGDLFESLHPSIEVNENCVVLSDDAIAMRRQVLSLLVGIGFDVVSVAQKRTTLEEIYAEVVQWRNVS